MSARQALCLSIAVASIGCQQTSSPLEARFRAEGALSAPSLVLQVASGERVTSDDCELWEDLSAPYASGYTCWIYANPGVFRDQPAGAISVFFGERSVSGEPETCRSESCWERLPTAWPAAFTNADPTSSSASLNVSAVSAEQLVDPASLHLTVEGVAPIEDAFRLQFSEKASGFVAFATIEGGEVRGVEGCGLLQQGACLLPPGLSFDVFLFWTPDSEPVSLGSWQAGDAIEAVPCEEGIPGAFGAQVPDDRCDQLDNDCDDRVDEGVRWYLDADADGWGDPAVVSTRCPAPAGYVANAGDCDDLSAAVAPDHAEACDPVDHDCDGSPTNGVPTGAEACNGLDDDCDGLVDEEVALLPETCDRTDEDCDGLIDEDATNALPLYPDADGDHYGALGSEAVMTCPAPGYAARTDDCDDGDPLIHPGQVEAVNGSDDDCDFAIDEDTRAFDDDSDGFTEDEGDCDDSDAAVSPGADELSFPCDDGIDQDCDGAELSCSDLEDGDHDGYTPLLGDCDDTRDEVSPAALERCDQRDNDCDGQVDEGGIDPSSLPPGAVIITGEAMDVRLQALLGQPVSPVDATVMVDLCAAVTSSSSESPALTTDGLPAGSTVTLINQGVIFGRGGDGAGMWDGGGHDGGDAIEATVQLSLDNQGFIYGGGGGGGSGDDPECGGGGAGGGIKGGDACGDGGWGVGGHGSGRADFGAEPAPGGDGALYNGEPGLGGAAGNPAQMGGGGSGGAASAYVLPEVATSGGQGGAGGGWGGGGGGGCGKDLTRNWGPGGAAGYAIRLRGGSVELLSGDTLDQLKGQVGE